MKVILLQDVKKVGKKDQIIEVSDGYASNFLIPKKLAIPFNERNISQLEANQARKIETDKQNKETAIKNKQKLEEKELVFILAVGANGKAFGAITAKKVEEEIKARFKVDVDRKKFINFSPLNHLGLSTIQIELYKDVVAQVRIMVKDKA